MSVRDLKTKTNYNRVGIGTWDKALKALVQARELRLDEKKSGSGRTAVTVILLKAE